MPGTPDRKSAERMDFRGFDVVGGHFTIEEARRHVAFNQIPILSMVRNPVDRCISETYRRIRNGNWDEEGNEHPAVRFAREYGSVMSEQLGGSVPQDVTFGVFERYQESLEMFADKFAWDQVPVLAHENAGNNRVEPENSVRDTIAGLLEDDFRIYDEVVASF